MSGPYREAVISDGLDAAELLGGKSIDWLNIVEDRRLLRSIDELSCSRDGVWADRPMHPMGRFRALVKVGLIVAQVTAHDERVLQDRIAWVKEILSNAP